MRIVSWNCHYGLSEMKAEKIQEVFTDIDIFVIQECKRTDMDAFKSVWKFKNWYGDDQDIKSDLGIAIFSRNHKVEFSNIFNRNFRYVVPYTIITNEKPLTLFAVWTKSTPIYYYDKNVTKAICADEYQALLKGNVIIIGDFNTGYTEDHQDRYENLREGLKGFKNCELGKPEEYKKTFFSYSKNKLYLNDFCFVSENISVKKFETNDIWTDNDYGQKSWRGLSDHCPIIVDLAL